VKAPKEIFQNYNLLKRLAVGGMGTIYLAQVSKGPAAGRIVVLKCISSEHTQNKEYRRLFESEIKTMLGLSHPNIVTMLDTGEENGKLFITLDWVEGRSIRQIESALPESQQRIPPTIATAFAIEAAKGLYSAHTYVDRMANKARPIVHRDISPTNILVGFDGAVKVIDFGIAKTLNDQNTQRTVVMGKVSYMSPEQFTGKPIDERTDIFSLGTVLWELLTGKKLFEGDSEATIIWKVTSRDFKIMPPSSLSPGIPPCLDVAILRALQRDREKRTGSMKEFGGDLQIALRKMDPQFSHDRIRDFVTHLFSEEMKKDRHELQLLHQELEEKEETAPLDSVRGPGASKNTRPMANSDENSIFSEFALPAIQETVSLANLSSSSESAPSSERVQSPKRPSHRPIDFSPPPRETARWALWKVAASLVGVFGLYSGYSYAKRTDLFHSFHQVSEKTTATGQTTVSINLNLNTTQATISVNDQPLGMGESEFSAPFGSEAKIVVSHPGYLAYKNTLTIPPNQKQMKLEVELVPEKWGTISVTTNLSAEVEVRSGPLVWNLNTPVDALVVPEGEYTVTIKNHLMQYEKVHQVLVRKGQAPRIAETIQEQYRAPASP
jgi:serine/threonine protein kinase